MNYYWEKDEVLGKLDVKMTSAFNAVLAFAKKKKLSLRQAAFSIAVARVAQACRDRGWL
jgi:glutamate dehydrogenase (NAD(P)+)